MSQETFQPVEQLSHGDDLPDHFAAALRGLPERRRLPHVNAWRVSRGLAPLDRLPPEILHRRATAGKATSVHDPVPTSNAAGAVQVHARKPAGAGTHLKGLLALLGLLPQDGFCSCNERAALMNAWGPAGCRERIGEIVEWLRQEADKASWRDRLAAATRAVTHGLVLNPLSPLESLVTIAIERAEASLRASS